MSTKYNTSGNNENEYKDLVDRICNDSFNNWMTNQYDNFQKLTNGIMV